MRRFRSKDAFARHNGTAPLPVWSGKLLGTRVPRDLVLPVFVLVVLFVALLLSYPWEVLTLGTLVSCFVSRSAKRAKDGASNGSSARFRGAVRSPSDA